jgi:hypothetical protein
MALTHEPMGKPGGPGLFHMKGAQLPAYIQHIRNDLIQSRGMPESQATQMAIGICQRWCRGGGDVQADTRAKACAAIAEWERLKARAHATRSEPVSEHDADGLDASWDNLDDLPDLTGLDVEDLEAVTGEEVERGELERAAKLGTGARFQALKGKLAAKGASNPGALAAFIGRKKFGKQRFTKLASTARKRKGGPAVASRTSELFRLHPLEECRIMRGKEGREYASGRFVEAYAAVFNQEAEIRDHQGHYVEDIDNAAFNDALRAAHPDRHKGFWNATCLYNHALTVHGTPAERFSMPAGLPRDIGVGDIGVRTVTEYAKTPLGDECIELVDLGALRTQSFTGGILRSNPELRGPGDKYRAQGGALQRVRRLVLGFREYGLTPFAAYSGAEVFGTRMQIPGDLTPGDYEGDEEDIEDVLTGDSPEAEDSPDSTGHRLYRLRQEEALRAAGIELRTT